MKYIDRINQTADETAKSNNALIAETAQLSIAQKTLACKKILAQNTQRLNELKNSKDFSPETIFAVNNAIELSKREIAYYESLTKELF